MENTSATTIMSFETTPTRSESLVELPQRKLVDEFEGEFAPEHTSTPILSETNTVEGEFVDVEGDVPDDEALEICETLSAHLSALEAKASVRRKKLFGSERSEKLREQLSKIDHSKKKSYCDYFTCVYDTNKVDRSTSDCNFSEITNTTVPIDFTAPHGEAYYNAKTGSPLVRLCDHDPCYPAQAQTFAAIKVFNMDGILSEEPIVGEGFLPWFPNRNHHKRGQEAESQMKFALRDPDQEGLTPDGQINFIDSLLKGTQKYPEGFFRNGNRLSFLDMIKEKGLEPRVTKMLAEYTNPTNDEIVSRIIAAAGHQLCESIDYEFVFNPFDDDQMSTTEISENQRGLGDSTLRYQPFDLFGTLMSNYKWFEVLPAVFYRVPASDFKWYENAEMAARCPASPKSLGEYAADYPTIGSTLPDEIASPVKVWFKTDNGMRQFNLSVSANGNTNFIKFPENKVLHFIDSLLDMAFLHGKDVRSVIKELDFMMAEIKYLNQDGFKPTRDEFGLREADKFEACEQESRKLFLKTNLIKQFDLPSFQFYFISDFYFGIKRGYNLSKDTYNYKFPFANLVTILRKLIRLAMHERSMAHVQVSDEHTNVYHYVRERVNKFLTALNNETFVRHETLPDVGNEVTIVLEDPDNLFEQLIQVADNNGSDSEESEQESEEDDDDDDVEENVVTKKQKLM